MREGYILYHPAQTSQARFGNKSYLYTSYTKIMSYRITTKKLIMAKILTMIMRIII